MDPKIVVVTGLALVGNTWNFLDEMYGEITLPSAIEIKRQDCSSASLEIYKTAFETVTINIAEHSLGTLSQVIISKASNVTLTSEECVSKISDCFVSAIDDSLQMLPPGPTKRSWESQFLAYKETLSDAYASKTIYRNIHALDLHSFGQLFNERMDKRLKLAFKLADVETYSIWHSFTISMKLEQFLKWKTCNIKGTRMKEIAIRLSCETSKNGYVLFWKLDTLMEILGPPTIESFIGLLKTVGNFKFTTNLEQTGKTRISEFDFASSIFEGIKEAFPDGMPFLQPKIADWLAKPRNHELEAANARKEFFRWIKNFKSIHEDLSRYENTYRNGGASFSVLVTTQNVVDCMKPAIRKSLALFYSLLKHLNIQSSIYEIKVDQYLHHLKLNAYPAVETLTYFLKKSEDLPRYIASQAEYITIQCCEAIMWFTFYGGNTLNRENVRHNTDVCQMLGLHPEEFRTSLIDSCFPPAPYILFSEFFGFENDHWIYNGPLLNPQSFYGEQTELVSALDYVNDLNQLRDVSIQDVDLDVHPAFGKLNVFVLSKMLEASDRLCFNGTFKNSKLNFAQMCKICGLKGIPVAYKTTTELQEDIEDGTRLGNVHTMLGLVYQSICLNQRSRWLKIFCNFLEEKLYLNEVFLPLLVNAATDNYIFIVPMKRLPMYRFDIMDSDTLLRFSRLFGKVFSFHNPYLSDFYNFPGLLAALHANDAFPEKVYMKQLMVVLAEVYYITRNTMLDGNLDSKVAIMDNLKGAIMAAKDVEAFSSLHSVAKLDHIKDNSKVHAFSQLLMSKFNLVTPSDERTRQLKYENVKWRLKFEVVNENRDIIYL